MRWKKPTIAREARPYVVGLLCIRDTVVELIHFSARVILVDPSVRTHWSRPVLLVFVMKKGRGEERGGVLASFRRCDASALCWEENNMDV